MLKAPPTVGFVPFMRDIESGVDRNSKSANNSTCHKNTFENSKACSVRRYETPDNHRNAACYEPYGKQLQRSVYVIQHQQFQLDPTKNKRDDSQQVGPQSLQSSRIAHADNLTQRRTVGRSLVITTEATTASTPIASEKNPEVMTNWSSGSLALPRIKRVSIGPRATRFAVTILGIKSKSTIPTSGCSAPTGPISSRPRSRSTEKQRSRVTLSQNATTIATWPFSNASRQQSRNNCSISGANRTRNWKG